jgi:type IV pilus assembly protein PilE
LFASGPFRSIAAEIEEKPMPRSVSAPVVPAAPAPRGRLRGFTLIEVMIAIVVVAILATVAYPQYTEFVQRSRIAEATSAMSDFRTRMEQFFQDNRTYVNGGACGVANPAYDAAESSFQILCTAPSAAGYTLNANGNAAKGMGSFQYRLVLNNAGVTRSTVAAPPGWGISATCWTVRKNGKCS